MQLTDSNNKKLQPAEIITIDLHNQPQDNVPVAAKMLAVTKALSGKNVKRKQIGNTLFFMFTSPKPHQDKLVGGAFNADTQENFMVNGMKFMEFLKKEKYTKFISDFSNPALLDAYRVWERKAVADGMLLDVIQKEDGTYRAIIVVDPEAYGDIYKQAGGMQ